MDQGLIRRLLELRSAESGAGTRSKDAPLRMSLIYPSPYRAGMSSLGFLQIHRLANARPLVRAERAFLPEPADLEIHRTTRTPLLTIESQRPASEAHLIGISHAYELELTGIVTTLELCGLEPLARDRDASDPLVVIGGPITFSNPLPTAPFADVMLLGEAEGTFPLLLEKLEDRPEAARGSQAARDALLAELAGLPGFYVPLHHGERLPPIGKADDELLPAYADLRTPNTELHDMVLIEPERGCHRGCTFCVMRRSTNDGMRLVDVSRVDSLVPSDAGRVGLVGAAVSDHPHLRELLARLVDERGLRVGISSLRADRLDDELVGLLVRGGYRSMTIALDAPSERMRDAIEKNLKLRHVEGAAELARRHGMAHLKMYVIVGLPDETDDDIEELIALANRLSRTLPIKLAVSPLVPKFHTPLARAPFAGEARSDELLKRLKKRVDRRVEVRAPSPKEAYVEYRLSQGGFQHGEAAIAAAHAGGGLNAWKRALASLPERFVPENIHELVPEPTRRNRLRVVPEAVRTPGGESRRAV